jgi:hypothetical protein
MKTFEPPYFTPNKTMLWYNVISDNFFLATTEPEFFTKRLSITLETSDDQGSLPYDERCKLFDKNYIFIGEL